MNQQMLPSDFRQKLLKWYKSSHRPLPWKGKSDPYAIWLSEIILQQTRVEQGLPYYHRFLRRFPAVEDLASASQEEVMKLWEGLGYYSRARNMHATARYVANELNGTFPDTYSGLLELKGVGPYTAAAIASFAYDLPHAVIDGNVFRVLSRVFGISTPTDSTQGKKQFSQLAERLLDKSRPGTYNQAIMDFGATHCTPKAPDCATCPFQDRCVAFSKNRIEELPVKGNKLRKKDRFFHYLVLEHNETVFLRKRVQKDIWQQLYEFPLLESSSLSSRLEKLSGHPDWQKYIGETPYRLEEVSKPFKQTLSHQNIHAIFLKISLKEAPPARNSGLISTNWENLHKFAFPKIIDWYLTDKSLYLKLY